MKLAAWRQPDTEVSIVVDRWEVQTRVDDQFVERAFDARAVWHYLLRIGPVAVLRKIRSRLAERGRNQKMASVGIGRVVEAPPAASLVTGQPVVFFAPNHGPEWSQICVDSRFVRPLIRPSEETSPKPSTLPPALSAIAGWSRYSGVALEVSEVQRELDRWPVRGAAEERRTEASNANRRDRVEADAAASGQRTAVLFGLGNFAKTQIVPHVRRHLSLGCVHEIDPDQIAVASTWGVAIDTSPVPRAHERYDAWFLAGFHHTHADLAVHALNAGAYAVVEKPLATTMSQVSQIEAALMRSSARRLFVCFQKRYSAFTDFARQDLALSAGDAVDMHCLVYEVPLPARHWYNWPNSGGRVVSNGCHWLDYFLFMNGYSDVVDRDARLLRDGDVHAFVSLRNGAQFTMSLTQTGSARIGMRDMIELRARDATVRMIDAARYEAESSAGVLRRTRANPYDAYSRMYESICRRIRAGDEGDDTISLASSRLTVELDEIVAASPRAARGRRAIG